MRYINDIEMEIPMGKCSLQAVVVHKVPSFKLFRFKVSDTNSDTYEWLSGKELSKDILGVADSYIYRISENYLKLCDLLHYVGDITNYDNIPDEIFHMSNDNEYFKNVAVDIYPHHIPENKSVSSGSVIFVPVDTSYCTDYICTPEDYIMYYLVTYMNDIKYTKEVIDYLNSNWWSNKVTSTNHDLYTDYNFYSCYVYRLYNNPCFQNIRSPLYISSDGDLYLGYGNNVEVTGALHYRVRDMVQFKRFITKSIVLGRQQ